ncbi:hypothetical protein [Streptacidiphilus sp. MAP5-52]|uniref:hypothetical protein n=1 Tax=Streptacidiphilus sp. MAP5-52 TaxID=3156267 RepID=UPI00351885CE
MTPGQPITMICPDCRTWRVLDRKMIKPHRKEDRGHDLHDRRCSGSGQRITLDVDITTWLARQERLLPDALQPETRRSAVQFYKPLPPAAPALREVAVAVRERAAALPTAAEAKQVLLAHRKACTECEGTERCERARSLDLVHRSRSDREQGQRRVERIEADLQVLRRGEQWAQIDATAKRVSTERVLVPAGAAVVSPIKGAGLPAGTPELPWQRTKKS